MPPSLERGHWGLTAPQRSGFSWVLCDAVDSPVLPLVRARPGVVVSRFHSIIGPAFGTADDFLELLRVLSPRRALVLHDSDRPHAYPWFGLTLDDASESRSAWVRALLRDCLGLALCCPLVTRPGDHATIMVCDGCVSIGLGPPGLLHLHRRLAGAALGLFLQDLTMQRYHGVSFLHVDYPSGLRAKLVEAAEMHPGEPGTPMRASMLYDPLVHHWTDGARRRAGCCDIEGISPLPRVAKIPTWWLQPGPVLSAKKVHLRGLTPPRTLNGNPCLRPSRRLVVQIDYHNVLDTVSISDAAAFWRALLDLNVVPYILSFIGFGTPNSEQRKRELEDMRCQLAEALGLDRRRVECPHPSFVYARVTSQRHEAGRGKAEWIAAHGTAIAIDDRADNLSAFLEHGTLGYQVLLRGKPAFALPPALFAAHERLHNWQCTHVPSRSFSEMTHCVLADLKTGVAERKLRALDHIMMPHAVDIGGAVSDPVGTRERSRSPRRAPRPMSVTYVARGPDGLVWTMRPLRTFVGQDALAVVRSKTAPPADVARMARRLYEACEAAKVEVRVLFDTECSDRTSLGGIAYVPPVAADDYPRSCTLPAIQEVVGLGMSTPGVTQPGDFVTILFCSGHLGLGVGPQGDVPGRLRAAYLSLALGCLKSSGNTHDRRLRVALRAPFRDLQHIMDRFCIRSCDA